MRLQCDICGRGRHGEIYYLETCALCVGLGLWVLGPGWVGKRLGEICRRPAITDGNANGCEVCSFITLTTGGAILIQYHIINHKYTDIYRMTLDEHDDVSAPQNTISVIL